MRWWIKNDLVDRVRLGWFSLEGVAVRSELPALQSEIAGKITEIRASFPGPASAAPMLAPARRLYHRLGIDPSKTRPSSEALVRRILQGKGLYQVNTAVDAGNLASISCFRPIGLYDSDRIDPEREHAGADAARTDPTPLGEIGVGGRSIAVAQVVLRLGREGEEYPGIGKASIHLAGRPAMVDRQGPFGNPSSDSDRTRVTLQTRSLLFVLFEPPDESAEAVESRLALCREIMIRHLGGVPDA